MSTFVCVFRELLVGGDCRVHVSLRRAKDVTSKSRQLSLVTFGSSFSVTRRARIFEEEVHCEGTLIRLSRLKAETFTLGVLPRYVPHGTAVVWSCRDVDAASGKPNNGAQEDLGYLLVWTEAQTRHGPRSERRSNGI